MVLLLKHILMHWITILAQFVADFGGSSKDLYRIVEREDRVSDWFQKGCGVPVLKPGEKFEPGLLECDQDILPQHIVFAARLGQLPLVS